MLKLRRSIIWGRGHDIEDAKEKLSGVAGDAFCVDLEDGVPLERKEEARKKAVEMLKTLDFRGKEKIVRINPVDTDDFYKDMEEVVAVGLPDSIRVPKCEHVRDMIKIDALLERIEVSKGLSPNSIEVIAMIESPIGIQNAYDIANSCERITALNLGMEDLTREMGLKRRYQDNDLDLIYARQKLVLDAKAAGVQAIDSVLLLVKDSTQASERQCLNAKQMGFTGCSCRDNKEAAFANQVFMPGAEEVKWANEAIEAYHKAIDAGENEIVFEGYKLCHAAYLKAVDLVNLAQSIQAQS